MEEYSVRLEGILSLHFVLDQDTTRKKNVINKSHTVTSFIKKIKYFFIIHMKLA